MEMMRLRSFHILNSPDIGIPKSWEILELQEHLACRAVVSPCLAGCRSRIVYRAALALV